MSKLKVRICFSVLIAVGLLGFATVSIVLAKNSLGYTFSGAIFSIGIAAAIRCAAVVAFRNKEK